MKNVTAIIKTFERPEAVRTLIKSIRKYYPKMEIVIGDDSRECEEITGKHIRYYQLPFDIGLSYGRNFLVRKVNSKYILLLDDDFVFTRRTKIEKFVEALENTDLDLVAGEVEQDNELVGYRGLLEKDGKTIHYIKGNRGYEGGIELFDLVLNFFLARRKVLVDNPWDNNLKVAEHTDWMYRTKHLKKGFLPGVTVINSRAEYREGTESFRKRGREFTYMWMEKHGVEKVVDFKGMEFVHRKPTPGSYAEIQAAARADILKYSGKNESIM